MALTWLLQLGPVLREILARRFNAALELNNRNVRALLDTNRDARLLDLGCDDGVWTVRLLDAVGQVWGVEIVHEQAHKAACLGVRAVVADLARRLPFADQSFDVVHSNQVIEHVPDIDQFLSEMYRVLRPGGYVVISTENGSSWHNVAAAIMGWQIFSATNVSTKAAGLGNPLALHRGLHDYRRSWTHKTILNYRGLIELLEVHGFAQPRVMGAGYYPLPAIAGRLDNRHAHFLAARAERPVGSGSVALRPESPFPTLANGEAHPRTTHEQSAPNHNTDPFTG